MGDDIRPGDLVVRVPRPPHIAINRDPVYPSPPIGRVFRVAEVVERPLWTALVFSEWPSSHFTGGWNSAVFRKLKDEPDNIELIERIKACKPVRQPAHV